MVITDYVMATNSIVFHTTYFNNTPHECFHVISSTISTVRRTTTWTLLLLWFFGLVLFVGLLLLNSTAPLKTDCDKRKNLSEF